MPIPEAWDTAETSSGAAKSAPNWERARADAHAGAGDYTAESVAAIDDNLVQFPRRAATDTDGDGAPGAEIVARTAPGPLVKVRDASKVWLSDAKVTAVEAFDGTVYRSRPPSIRDRVTRVRRATWAGDMDGLRKFGQAASIPPLIAYITLQAVAWLCAPLRFYVFLAIAVVIVVLAI